LEPGLMRVWTFASSKGGAGRSTLATQLAVLAEQSGEIVLLVDLDPQRSAVRWGEVRQGTPDVLPCLPEKLKGLLKEAKGEGVTLALVDTAPHSDAAALTAMRLATRVLCPVRPAMMDTAALLDTLKLVDMAEKRDAAIVIINGVPPRGEARADAADEAIAQFEIAVCPVRIGYRIAFMDATDQGQGVTEIAPKDKASVEITALWKQLSKGDAK
jgi:chromosome partitioning protein